MKCKGPKLHILRAPSGTELAFCVDLLWRAQWLTGRMTFGANIFRLFKRNKSADPDAAAAVGGFAELACCRWLREAKLLLNALNFTQIRRFLFFVFPRNLHFWKRKNNILTCLNDVWPFKIFGRTIERAHGPFLEPGGSNELKQLTGRSAASTRVVREASRGVHWMIFQLEEVEEKYHC